MVATVAASADQYLHSVHTLRYADRAKEIKTHVVRNVGTVEHHVAEYKRIIENLQSEVHVSWGGGRMHGVVLVFLFLGR